MAGEDTQHFVLHFTGQLSMHVSVTLVQDRIDMYALQIEDEDVKKLLQSSLKTKKKTKKKSKGAPAVKTAAASDDEQSANTRVEEETE